MRAYQIDVGNGDFMLGAEFLDRFSKHDTEVHIEL
jgi:hypothetical protein